jgi:hypothetical protein
MRYCIEICTKLLLVLKSIIFFTRQRFLFFFRFILLVIFCLLLLYLSSVHYYTVYCDNRFTDGLNQANKHQLWNTLKGVQDKFIPILMPVCDRPHYLKRVIDGLIKVDGINEVKLS